MSSSQPRHGRGVGVRKDHEFEAGNRTVWMLNVVSAYAPWVTCQKRKRNSRVSWIKW